jgi:hypothetical protein
MKQLIGQRVTICYGVSDSTGVGNIVGDIIDDVNGWLHVRVVSLHGSGNIIKLVPFHAIKYVSISEDAYKSVTGD